ncbi:hypothetical protein OS493_029389 [Desmophyllum pertusum]|uniref:G-protein coupled receptors family 1 profile domain-containing protein n=1 Tax=Desmophyllum pertusum TaxID=174260 RepID=A0A9X0CPF9_9CNID|nr:hypothetical protein OS493_029389 [Desmophyllum pertusum]
MSYQTGNGGNMTGSDNYTRPGKSGFGIPPDTIPAMVIMVFILVINFGVILLISCYSSLRTTSNIILGSLAVSDFLVGFVGIPLLVTCSSIYTTSICVSTNIFLTFMALSTVLHITVMTCDRYIYIMRALRYHDIVRRSKVLKVLGLTCAPFMDLEYQHPYSKRRPGSCKEERHNILYVQYHSVFLHPLIVMIVLDAHMLLLLRKQCKRIARENLPVEFVKREKKLQKRQRRAVLTCVLLLILYVIFWLPYFILELLQQNHYGQIPYQVITFIYYLRLCTSLFNPLTYTLRKYDLKTRAKCIFKKMFFCWRKNETKLESTRKTNASDTDAAL